MRTRFLLLPIATVCLTVTWAFAETVDPPLGPNWCEQARASLVRTNGKPFDCRATNLRCVKMNNYGCLKQPQMVSYLGTNWGGHDGARDKAGHSIFAAPAMSLVAIANLYRKYQKAGRKTATQIADRYSPWCDTLGSVTRRQDRSGNWWYRTCGSSKPPAGAKVCQGPANGVPRPGQCQACNCPSEVAKQMLKGTGIGVHDELVLFSADKPNELLLTIMANKMRQELGYAPAADLLDAAKASYRVQEW